MKRSAASILVSVFVAAALLAARSNARSHPNEQGVTSLNDDYPDFIPCDECSICTRSYPPKCRCEDLAPFTGLAHVGCRDGCKTCAPVMELKPFPIGFRCLDMAYYDCKNHHHWLTEPTIITTTTETIN